MRRQDEFPPPLLCSVHTAAGMAVRCALTAHYAQVRGVFDAGIRAFTKCLAIL